MTTTCGEGDRPSKYNDINVAEHTNFYNRIASIYINKILVITFQLSRPRYRIRTESPSPKEQDYKNTIATAARISRIVP